MDILGVLIPGIILIVFGLALFIASRVARKHVPAAPVVDVEVGGAQMPGVPVVVSVPAADVPLDQQYPVAPVATVPVAAVAQPVPEYQPGAAAATPPYPSGEGTAAQPYPGTATAPYPGTTAAPYPSSAGATAPVPYPAPAPYPSTQPSYPTAPTDPSAVSNQPVYPPGANIPEVKGHDDALPSYDDATRAPV